MDFWAPYAQYISLSRSKSTLEFMLKLRKNDFYCRKFHLFPDWNVVTFVYFSWPQFKASNNWKDCIKSDPFFIAVMKLRYTNSASSAFYEWLSTIKTNKDWPSIKELFFSTAFTFFWSRSCQQQIKKRSSAKPGISDLSTVSPFFSAMKKWESIWHLQTLFAKRKQK